MLTSNSICAIRCKKNTSWKKMLVRECFKPMCVTALHIFCIARENQNEPDGGICVRELFFQRSHSLLKSISGKTLLDFTWQFENTVMESMKMGTGFGEVLLNELQSMHVLEMLCLSLYVLYLVYKHVHTLPRLCSVDCGVCCFCPVAHCWIVSLGFDPSLLFLVLYKNPVQALMKETCTCLEPDDNSLLSVTHVTCPDKILISVYHNPWYILGFEVFEILYLGFRSTNTVQPF